MAAKYYLNRLWLSQSLSFFFFVPYLKRYLDEYNRFIFHWNRVDLLALLFCVVLLGMVFFLCFVGFYIRGRKHAKKIFTIFFISAVGLIATATLWQLGNQILSLIFSSPWKISVTRTFLGYFLWTLLGFVVLYTSFKHTLTIKTICITLCLIISPLPPIFFLNAVSFPSITANIGTLPTPQESVKPTISQKENIYIFIFDEWSYWRSFNNRNLIAEFINLQQFKNASFTFHHAYPASAFTFTSIPGLLFQTTKRFTVEGGKQGFKSERFYSIDEMGTIFHHPRELGYYTSIVGSYLPYGELLQGNVDFAKSISDAKWFGNSFFDVTKGHLITALLSFPTPFFDEERKVLTHYFKNQFQVKRNSVTHNMFKTVIRNQTGPTYAVFHYMLPHHPFIYNREGPKKLFNIYQQDVSNYYGNLAYLDSTIGNIISTLKKANKFNNSLIIITSDHSWRKDYMHVSGNDNREKYLIPLFIKLPYQEFSSDIERQFNTSNIGSFTNYYLDKGLTVEEARILFEKEDYFSTPSIEMGQPLLSD